MEKEEIDYNELKGRKNPKEDKDIAALSNKKKPIVILEHANLELTNDKRNPEIINS